MGNYLSTLISGNATTNLAKIVGVMKPDDFNNITSSNKMSFVTQLCSAANPISGSSKPLESNSVS